MPAVHGSSPNQEDVDRGNASILRTNLYKASLDSWAMKPLVSTAGMKEGTVNEIQVLRAIPAFLEEHCALNASLAHQKLLPALGTQYRAGYVRSVGLVASKSDPMLADSHGGLIWLTTDDGNAVCAAVEVKTMASPNTIEKAKRRRDAYSPFVSIYDVRNSASSAAHFKEYLVDSTGYRFQCIHHCVVTSLKRVLYIVAKGSSNGVGEILYAALIEFADAATSSHSFWMDSVRLSAFDWVGKHASHIPSEYDILLSGSHSPDLYSLASHYNLCKAYKMLVDANGPLPPSRMVRPTLLVYWNALKGGVDEFSWALKSLAYTNSSENPIVGVIGRPICGQVCNAAIVHRIAIARTKGYLLNSEEHATAKDGYKNTRHRVTSCASFGAFARCLSRKCVQMASER